MSLLELQGVCKSFGYGADHTVVLNDVNLSISAANSSPSSDIPEPVSRP